MKAIKVARCQESFYAESKGEYLVNVEFTDGYQSNGFFSARTLFDGKKKARDFRRELEKIERKTPPPIKLVTLGPRIYNKKVMKFDLTETEVIEATRYPRRWL